MKSPLVKLLLILGPWRIPIIVAASASTDASFWQGPLATRILARSTEQKQQQQQQRRRQLTVVPPSGRVRMPKLLPGDGIKQVEQSTNNDDELKNCDIAFYECLTNSVCADCFSDMKNKDVDWTGVTEDTDCSVVVPILTKAGLCPQLENNKSGKDLFCDAFHACVYFDDDDDDEQDGGGNDNKKQNDKDKLDCQTLTECKWPGIHESFVGDGVCHDNYGNSCYNSAMCNWDGGDCCKDTCNSDAASYLQCGSDGYACRNPSSSNCDPSLTNSCPADKNSSNNNGKDPPKCEKDKSLYRLEMYDSFGDGWEGTTLTVTVKNGVTKPIFSGALESGAEGTEYLCLSKDPKCYIVETTGGMWGREASWDVRAYAEGSPVVALGCGSMKCEFMVAGGADCENSCTGKNNVDPTSDPDYKDFKKMVNCIDEKCLIQAEACRNDEACKKCFDEDVPEYCYSIASFNAVADCSMCNCLGADFDLSDFCDKKSAPGVIPIKPANGGQNLEPRQCTPSEVLLGSTALMDFSRCMHNSQEQFMVSEFDENNFGDLDTFETCAHGFRDKADHGGHTALSCMQILVNAINEDVRPGEPTEAISQLASLLYNEGSTFCDCAKKASDECPLCPSFYNFKTLLYESLDACQSLDMIDCDAWNEFQEPCKVNLMAKFSSVNLAAKEQCDYMMGDCGGAGPFPSFRRLDCQSELPAGSWDFYKEFEKFCYQGKAGPEPPSAPVPLPPPVPRPAPTPTPPLPTKRPTYYENVTPSIQPPPSDRKPYVPPEDRGKPTYKSSDDKKSSHWFRNLVLICLAGGVGYYIYNRQSEFSMVRYRRIGGMGGGFGFRGGGGGFNVDDSDMMYSGLSLESSTNFEPPSLPPTPMSMPSNGGYGA